MKKKHVDENAQISLLQNIPDFKLPIIITKLFMILKKH